MNNLSLKNFMTGIEVKAEIKYIELKGDFYE